MGKSSSADLRVRIYGEIERGETCRSAARRSKARTIDDLWQAVGPICDLYSPDECKNYLTHAGYRAD